MDQERRDAEFVKLLTQHQTMTRLFIQSLIPGSSDADDILQETNEILWKKRDEFRAATSFKAWAFQIARYRVMNYQRHQRRRRARLMSIREDVRLQLEPELEAMDPEELAQRNHIIRKCLSLLRPDFRAMILQRYWKDTSVKKLADQYERSEGAIKTLLHRIRQTLKNCIERHGSPRGTGDLLS